MIVVNLLIIIFDWLATLLFPGVPNILTTVFNFINSQGTATAVTHFREWMGYVFYFIPWSFVQPFLLATVGLIMLRIVFALFRMITDIL